MAARRRLRAAAGRVHLSPPRRCALSSRPGGAPDRLAGLVAFHSAAATEAEALGLADELAEFTDERTIVRDLLWYADMTVGPTGEPVTFAERMDELRERYPSDHYVIRALDASMPERAGRDRPGGAVDRGSREVGLRPVLEAVLDPQPD